MSLKMPVAIDALWLIARDWFKKVTLRWADSLSRNLTIPTDLIEDITNKEWEFKKDKSKKTLSRIYKKWTPLIISAITKLNRSNNIRLFFAEYVDFLKNLHWEKAEEIALDNFTKSSILLEFNQKEFWIRTIWSITSNENFKKKYGLVLIPRKWK